MKNFKLLMLIAVVTVFSACSSVRVSSDYDQNANFNEYKSFAFFKPGIDKAEISDLDKKRILRAIEDNMLAKGFVKSDNPTMLVSIFTTAQQRVDVYNNFGWGWGAWGPWGPYGAGFGNTVSRSTEGTLYIDLIDASKKELVWQGQGTVYLAKSVDKKQERINEIVGEIMQEYPPKQMASN